MQRRKSILAAMKDVPMLVVCRSQAQRSKLAVMKDAPTILEEGGCAGVVVLNGYVNRGVRTSLPGV